MYLCILTFATLYILLIEIPSMGNFSCACTSSSGVPGNLPGTLFSNFSIKKPEEVFERRQSLSSLGLFVFIRKGREIGSDRNRNGEGTNDY